MLRINYNFLITLPRVTAEPFSAIFEELLFGVFWLFFNPFQIYSGSFNKINFISFREIKNYNPEMEKKLHIKHKGKFIVGYNAIILISTRLPILWVLIPVLFIIKSIGLGEILYEHFATKRKIVPINHCSETCDFSEYKS